MPIRLGLSSSKSGEWYITSNGTYLVGFSGPHARELAIKQQRELAALLGVEHDSSDQRGNFDTGVPDSTD
jgi:hypothetical protein